MMGELEREPENQECVGTIMVLGDDSLPWAPPQGKVFPMTLPMLVMWLLSPW